MMDAVDRQVKLLVGREMCRAYGVPPQTDPEWEAQFCAECKGDGCIHCDNTGDAS